MNWHRLVVISVSIAALNLGLPINRSTAAEKAPSVYFATSDPFLDPGEKPKLNDITIFGGPFAKNPFGGAIHIFGVDYTQNYLLGVTYGRNCQYAGAARPISN